MSKVLFELVLLVAVVRLGVSLHAPCLQIQRPSLSCCRMPDPAALQSLDHTGRRSFLSVLLIAPGLIPRASPASAAVTDETDNFAETWWSKNLEQTGSAPTTGRTRLSPTPDDELTFRIRKSDMLKGLGLELADVDFKTNLRVYVKSVRRDSLAEKLGMQPNWIVIAVNGQSAERTNAKGVTEMIMESGDNEVALRFRDPSVFRAKLAPEQLQQSGGSVTTQVAPAGDTTQRRQDGNVRMGSVTSQANQQVSVSQLVAPKVCTRGAQADDLMEISYIGRVADTGAIFDGSAIKIDNRGIPGRGDDVSLYFVLGKQPFGQFPPGWDVGLVGMCVGERRRLLIPPVLAYGDAGLPRRNIPPRATLQYDVTLVSVNGLSTPQ